MRENWSRAQAALVLQLPDVTKLVSAAVPGASATSSTPAGGLANTVLDVRLDKHPWRVLLRLYQRAPAEAWKETAITDLVGSRGVPTARFLHFAERNEVTGHPYAVLEWIDGKPLEEFATTVDDEALAPLSRRVGGVLARIHSIQFNQAGTFDRQLNVAAPIAMGRAGLQAHLQHCLVEALGGERLGPSLTGRVMKFVERHGQILNRWPGTPCLVHADFHGANIVVCQNEAAQWDVGGILDWEYAHSGSPSLDLGHLLRPPLGERRGFAQAIGEGYREVGGTLPEGWVRIARIADLQAWADLLNRPEIGDAVIADARRIIARTIRAN